MPETTDVTLASGLWRDGRCLRAARLARLDAATQRTLVETLAQLLPARRASELVAAAVDALDGEPFALDDARALTIGDRDRVVLALRRALSGESMECVWDCACGQRLEVVVSLDALLGAVPPEPAPLERAGVRAATGADHERAARRALEDPAAAAAELVRSCMVGEHDPDAAARLLEELDPGAEILLRGTCPACGGDVLATLDPVAYLWAELEQGCERLEHEVHTLASHYHWSEAEIVALGPRRRKRYLELIDAEAGLA